MYTYSLVIHLNDVIGLLRDNFPTIQECIKYGMALERSNILLEPYTLECIGNLWV